MISRRRLGAVLLVLVDLCVGLAMTAACTNPTSCARALAWPLIVAVGGVLFAAVVGACTVRCAWLAAVALRVVDRLPVDRAPSPTLIAASSRLGIQHLRCLLGDEPVAFTVGALRPSVYVSRGLAKRLTGDSLTAVLAHEAHHASRRDPLRRAIRRALADVLVVAPILRWWADRSAERDELAADRAALRVVSPRTLADALLVTASPAPAAALAAFDGAAAARAAQLLGEPLPARRCPWRLLVASAAGTAGMGAAAVCAAQLLAQIS